MQKLLVSIRGYNEAKEAAKGGAHITDVEYPASALGTPYPLNILSVRQGLNKSGYKKVIVSTNIGELQVNKATACQAALGVACAGADIIKFGLAEETLESAIYLGDSLVRTVRKFFGTKRRLIPSVFIDSDLQRYFKPLKRGVKLAKDIKADGILIDTFNKSIGMGLLDYCSIADVKTFVRDCHKNNIETWIAGSITKDELTQLWKTGVDVICVRGAACEHKGTGRFGKVKENIVKSLISTMK
jgi:hypothetical protein